jgi:hypothetical protein
LNRKVLRRLNRFALQCEQVNASIGAQILELELFPPTHKTSIDVSRRRSKGRTAPDQNALLATSGGSIRKRLQTFALSVVNMSIIDPQSS